MVELGLERAGGGGVVFGWKGDERLMRIGREFSLR